MIDNIDKTNTVDSMSLETALTLATDKQLMSEIISVLRDTANFYDDMFYGKLDFTVAYYNLIADELEKRYNDDCT